MYKSYRIHINIYSITPISLYPISCAYILTTLCYTFQVFAISPSVVHSKTLFRQLLSVDYLLFSLYVVVQTVQYGYYPTTVDAEYGSEVSDFQGG